MLFLVMNEAAVFENLFFIVLQANWDWWMLN